MHINDFKKQTERLVNHFGNRFISEEKIKLLWSKFSSTHAVIFGSMTDEVIGNTKGAPTLTDFEIAYSKVRASFSAKEKPVSCRKCTDGLISALSEDNLNYTFRCDCEAGKDKSESIELWRSELTIEGFKPNFGRG